MSFFALLALEFKTLFSDRDILLTIFGGVLLYAFLYPQPYLKESVTALNVAVVDLDKSELSRSMTFMLDAGAQITVDSSFLTPESAKNALITGKVSAIVLFPAHFKRDLLMGKSPVISVGADATYFLIYGGVVEGAMRSIMTQSAAVQIGNLLKKGLPLVGAKEQYTPFKTKFINIFNPTNSYINYVIPAVFVLILQQTMLIGMGIMGAGQSQQTLQKKSAYFNTQSISAVMMARFIAFGSIFFLHMLFYFGYVFHFFGVPHIAQTGELLLFGFAFLFAVGALGILLGAVFKAREYPTPIILLSSLPLVFSAGFVWPLEAMPQWLIWLSNFSPSTPGIPGFLRLNQMGASFEQVLDQFRLLGLQTLLYSLSAYVIMKYQRSKLAHRPQHQ